MNQNNILKIENLKKYFPLRTGLISRLAGKEGSFFRAVDDISFTVGQGEILGFVGESGCGKSTMSRTILKLVEPTAGRVYFNDTRVDAMGKSAFKPFRRKMQMIFQDPYASLNPRMTVGSIVGAPLDVHTDETRKDRRKRVQELLDMVGLNPDFINRYPHEFSGGQRQRIGIARALALNPDFVVCDEPISSLDVSIQAQVVNLLEDLQLQLGLTYLFIAHDLSMVRHISDRMAVMYLGKIVELADRDEIFLNSLHPYTQALMSAVPVPDPELADKKHRVILEGDIPNPSNPPVGCNFNTRCPIAKSICFEDEPEYREVKEKHWVACHLVKSSQSN